MSWGKYVRTGVSEMRPYVAGEPMQDISVSAEDDPQTDMGMIARNPKNHADKWYVARAYFEENLAPVNNLLIENTLEMQLNNAKMKIARLERDIAVLKVKMDLYARMIAVVAE